MSPYSSNPVLSCRGAWIITRLTSWALPGAYGQIYLYPTLNSIQQAWKSFYITPFLQKNLASRENYASELYQVMITRLLKVGRTSCSLMVGHGHVRFMLFQNLNIFFLCMKNWGKIDLFQTTCTHLCRLFLPNCAVFAGANIFIH